MKILLKIKQVFRKNKNNKNFTGAASALSRKEEAAEINRRRTSQPLYNKKQQQITQKKQPINDESITSTDDEPTNDEFSDDKCPEPNGYFPDAEQCDKYYDCRDGKLTEKLCPDGQVFNDFSPQHEKCDLPFGIDCSKRPKLREYIIIFC